MLSGVSLQVRGDFYGRRFGIHAKTAVGEVLVATVTRQSPYSSCDAYFRDRYLNAQSCVSYFWCSSCCTIL